MDKERLLNIITRPEAMDYVNDPLLFMETIDKYPYYQPAYALLARAYTVEKNIYAEKYTRLAAAYTADREVLYHIIHPASIINIPEKDLTSSQGTKDTEVAAYGTSKVIAPIIEKLPEAKDKEAEIPELEPLPKIEEIETEAAQWNDQKSLTPHIEPEIILEASPEGAPMIPEALQDTNIADDAEEPLIAIEPITKDSDPTSSSEHNKEEERPLKVVRESKTELKTFLDNLGMSTLASYDYFAYYQKMQDLAAKKEAEASKKIEATADEKTPTEAEEKDLQIKNSLKTDNKEGAKKEFSFTEWIKNLGNKPVVTPLAVPAEQAKNNKSESINKNKRKDATNSNSLIDKFIKSDPTIKRTQAKIFTPEDMAIRSAEEDPNIATETLAYIYSKQGLYNKALEVFQQLILRYPNKKAYYMEKMEEVQNKKTSN